MKAAGLWDRWVADSRAEALGRALAVGVCTLTIRSTLLFKLRRP